MDLQYIIKKLRFSVSPSHPLVIKEGKFDPQIKQERKISNNNIIYHDFLPTPRRGSHVKSGKNTHTVIKIHPLAHILDS